MDAYGIVEGFYVLKDKPVGMIIVFDSEAIKPFPLDQ
jgi:hypothetical protein